MHVWKTGIGREAGRVLVQALREGAWPQLRWIGVAGYAELFVDEEVKKGLVEVLGGGKVPCLEHLEVRGSGMSKEVAARILDAVKRGACPRLNYIAAGRSVEERGVGSVAMHLGGDWINPSTLIPH